MTDTFIRTDRIAQRLLDEVERTGGPENRERLRILVGDEIPDPVHAEAVTDALEGVFDRDFIDERDVTFAGKDKVLLSLFEKIRGPQGMGILEARLRGINQCSRNPSKNERASSCFGRAHDLFRRINGMPEVTASLVPSILEIAREPAFKAYLTHKKIRDKFTAPKNEDESQLLKVFLLEQARDTDEVSIAARLLTASGTKVSLIVNQMITNVEDLIGQIDEKRGDWLPELIFWKDYEKWMTALGYFSEESILITPLIRRILTSNISEPYRIQAAMCITSLDPQAAFRLVSEIPPDRLSSPIRHFLLQANASLEGMTVADPVDRMIGK